ncbi:MAG: type II toxin-antitoxin system VapC family toxin [Chloroflexota bacterium]|nr:type II toxin-antitoxin system VapC family toxin [Chloroflexota bacterium]
MNFVDANVFLYAVGNRVDLREQAYEVFESAERNYESLCTSAGVLEEICFVLWREGNDSLVGPALELVSWFDVQVWALEQEDVQQAVILREMFRSVDAMDLCYLASCLRRNVSSLETFDRELARAAAEILA